MAGLDAAPLERYGIPIPMPDYLIVLIKTVAMFLVILTGWYMRRRGYLTAELTGGLSRIVVDIAFPALVFTQMLKTVNAGVLREYWYLPVVGALILVSAQVTGWLMAPVFVRRGHRPTFVFLASVPNWVYLPLPIVAALFLDQGVTTVFLYNVGAQLVLWSLGVWTLRGIRPDGRSLLELLRNIGLMATAAGILLAVFAPSVARLDEIPPPGAPAGWLVASAFVQALGMVGSITVPLSLLVTGAQLGAEKLAIGRPSSELVGVLVTRLALAPCMLVALTLLAGRLGFHLPDVPRLTAYLIACMPVAVSCSLFTERYGGDTRLGARAIFLSTLFSIATLPLFYWAVTRCGF